MVKRRREDIEFNSIIYLSEDNHKKLPIYMRLLQAFIIYIGSYCFMSIFIKCFDLQIINIYIILAILSSGVIFSSFIIFPRYNLIKLVIVLTVYAGILYNRYEQLKNGFFLLENAIIKRASYYYEFPEFSFVADRSMAARDVTLLLIMIIIPVVGIITMALLGRIGKIICYIVMLLPVIISLSMGVTPPEIELISYILVFLFLIVSNGFSHDKSSLHKSLNNSKKNNQNMLYRISLKSASIFCLLVLLLFLLIKQLVPQEEYNDFNSVYEMKTEIQSFMTEFSIVDFASKLNSIKWNIGPNRLVGTGGLGLGELGGVDQVIYDETEHLHIRAPLQSVIEGIYLKGYIGSRYTGDSWETHARQSKKNYDEMVSKISLEDYEPAIGATILLDQIPFRDNINQGRIEISYDRANRKYIYAPYFTMFDEETEVSFEYDLSAIANKEVEVGIYNYCYNLPDYSDYTMLYNESGFYALSSLAAYSKLKKFHENEKIYRDFVYETYTMLPEKGLDRLKHDFSRKQLGAAAENLKGAIEYVKDYLNQNMSYSLSPGRLPSNKDFVEYFLYENKIGYCAHFASAGALMLRAMGYPARYVEGYAINRSDLMNQTLTSFIDDGNHTVDIVVRDYNAHAWVEVYYDGFGWIPVEFTGGSGMEDMVELIGDIDYESQETIYDNPAMHTAITPSPTELPPMEIEASEPGQDEEVKGDELELIGKEGESLEKEFRWYGLFIFLFVPLACVIVYQLLRLRRNKVMDRTKDCYSKKALRLYKAIEGLFIINKGLPKRAKSLEDFEEYAKSNLVLVPVEDFEACMDTVRKARFGRGSISSTEYMIVERFYINFRNKIYNGLPLIKKLFFNIFHHQK